MIGAVSQGVTRLGEPRGTAVVSFEDAERETLIGAVTFVLLPLTFLSGAFMQLSLVPGWIANVARFNPVNWAVVASRSAGARDADWSIVGSRLGMLAVLLVVSTMLATRAFRAYQHSL